MPSRAEIQKYVRVYIQKMLNRDLEERTAGVHYTQQFKDPTGEVFYPPEEDALVETLEKYDEELASGKYHLSSRVVDTLLQKLSLSISKHSHDYKRFCHEMCLQTIEAGKTEIKRNHGDFSDVTTPPQPAPLTSTPQMEEQGPNLSEVISLYFEANAHLAPKTIDEYTATYRVVQEILGDQPIKSIDRSMMRNLKRTLLHFPSNREKRAEFKDKSIADIMKMDVTKPLSNTSVNKYLIRTSTLFKFAMQEGFVERNHAEGLVLKKEKRPHEERDAFSFADLTNLFQSRGYCKDKFRHSYEFWIPVLALFTGGRLNELCQLHLNDIKEVDGLMVMEISDEGEKKTKTRSSNRTIPLHPFLIKDLDLLGRVELLRSCGDIRLFPELRKERDGYGQVVSKWFARYRKSCGITAPGKVLHSFRHTFINELKQARVNPDIIRELDGHKGRDMTMDRYGKPFTPDILYNEAILKLSFDGLDLSHLSQCKWAGR